MCGIAGIADFSATGADAALVERMTERLAHRGPDDAGVWASDDGRAAFGHRRLSIIDLSRAGHQPMANEDGSLWITYNGEVYNHLELREDLERRGHRYRSNTDTETILHLYEEEGPRCVERLRGMFAFAVWDTRSNELFLARDRLGIKPLYVRHAGGRFLFASEIKALLADPDTPRDLDEAAFFHYLTFACVPPPMTMFAGVEKLAPAERMLVDADGRIHRETYWTPFSEASAREVGSLDDAGVEERLLELLRESIRLRMMADVPFGVFLSGGIDSSTNVALMSERVDRVRTFSIGFRDQPRYDELGHARRVAEAFGTDHHEVVIDSHEMEEFIPELVHHQDEPLADWVCVPLHYLSRLARESGTIVVHVGEGSDELLHGYDHYVQEARFRRRYWPFLRRLPRPLTRAAARGASDLAFRMGRGMNTAHRLRAAATHDPLFWGGAIVYRGELKQRVAGRSDVPSSAGVVSAIWDEAERLSPRADYLQKMSYLELRLRLAELLLMRVDKMTMANSVEARVPFLDHRLVEFLLALPPRLKVRGRTGKYLLKRAVADLLPQDLVHRPKQGFSAPVAEWFRGDFGVAAESVIRQSGLRERGLLSQEWIDRLWEAHRSGRGNWSFQLWALYNVSAWYDHWIDGRHA